MLILCYKYFFCTLIKKELFPHFYDMNFKRIDRVVRIAIIGIIIYSLCFGIAMAIFPIRPFWNDEWRLVYNIKFKNVHQLWGTLDLLQQCPRTYLTLLKGISSSFDYSYTSLRLPPLVIGFFNILLCIYLKKKLFQNNSTYNYLFILIFISSQTFTDYIVQVKQYEMDLFLCLVALWQLIVLLDLFETKAVNTYKYVLLCISFLGVPFFSYIYPIVVAPIFPIILLKSISYINYEEARKSKPRLLFLAYMPLILVTISIIIFYFIDVKQLMADNRMYASYQKMLGNEKGDKNFIKDLWNLFALVGSGFIYEIIFGVLGIASFLYGSYRLAKIEVNAFTKEDYFKLYSVLLIIITLGLFLSGKLLGGVARLVCFTVPSISILIISFLDEKVRNSSAKLANIVATILFLGLFLNIITSFINRFTYPEYANRIKTYWNTGDALKQARLGKLPILITNGALGDKINKTPLSPGKITTNTITPAQIAGADTVCAEVVVKDNPEYKTWDSVTIYTIPDIKWINDYMKQLPPQYTSAIAGDGVNFMKLKR